jgi:serine/threonine protein phosphatase PrpC
VRFSVYQVSRKGGRAINQDRMGYCYTRHAGFFAVADGLGGHPQGEVASQLALQTLAARFQAEASPRLAEPAAFLQGAIQASHERLLRYATDQGLPESPRTTVVAFVLQGNSVHWAHCGDSRLYVVRGGKVVARTRDHSYSELESVLARWVPMGGRPRHNRSVLFTCLGSPGKPLIDGAGPLALLPGDRILLCSDGLWGVLPEEVLVEGLAGPAIADAVPELIEQALRLGGPRSDNVTALAVEWEAAESDETRADGTTLTDSLGEEVFASTIQSSFDAEGLVSELDEADIERSIREINEAIRRSTPHTRRP